MCWSEKPPILQSNSPNQPPSSAEAPLSCARVASVAAVVVVVGGCRIRHGCCELAARAASLKKTHASLCRYGGHPPIHPSIPPPLPCLLSATFTPPPSPTHPPSILVSSSLTWPRATGPPLIRSADRPCPHRDPSSLENVNLPVAQTGRHTHTHTRTGTYAPDAHI